MRSLRPFRTRLQTVARARRNRAALWWYAALLSGVVSSYTVIFQLIMHEVEGQTHSWVTAVYWVLTVMTTLGLGDIVFSSDVGRAFSSLVLLSGVVLLLVMLPFVFISFFYARLLGAHVRIDAPRAVPRRVLGHVLVTCFNDVAQGLVDKLKVHGIPHFILEPDPVRAAQLVDEGWPVVTGDLEHVDTWEALGVSRASLVVANHSDAQNCNLALTVREVSPRVSVAAVVSSEGARDVLEAAGCGFVLPLKQRLGEQLANRVSAEHAEAHVIGTLLGLQVAEFPVHGTPLVGKPIRELVIRDALGINIIAVWERGKLLPAPPDHRLSEQSVLVVLGTPEQLLALNSFLVIYHSNYNPLVIIGGGVVGCSALKALRRQGIAVHVVEREAATRGCLEELADRVILGDAARREVLIDAGILDAPSVLISTNDDATNIYLALLCRKLNPGLRVVSRITHEKNKEAVFRAGADFVLSSASLGADELFAYQQGHSLVLLGEGVDLYFVPVPRALEGLTLAESAIASRTGLNVIAVQKGAEVIRNPGSSLVMEHGQELIMLGSVDQRARFSREYGDGRFRGWRRRLRLPGRRA